MDNDTTAPASTPVTPSPSRLWIYFDGASKGNPGPSAGGFVLYKNSDLVCKDYIILEGNQTNNVAEYSGLIAGLHRAIFVENWGVVYSPESTIISIRGDSEIVIKQLKGIYRINAPHLKPLYQKTKELLTSFDKFTLDIQHVLREDNKEADLVANEGIRVLKERQRDVRKT